MYYYEGNKTKQRFSRIIIIDKMTRSAELIKKNSNFSTFLQL